MLKKFFLIILFLFSLVPLSIYAQTSNVGFVPTNIWYSKDPFSEGDKIKIYTLIFNPDSRQLSGTVDFLDGSTLLGTKDFKISGTTAQDIYINWTVTVGEHAIFGQIENAKFLQTDGTYETISLVDNKTQSSSRTVAKKVIPEGANSNTNLVNQTVSNAVNTAVSLIPAIGQAINNKIPASVTKPINTTMNSIEEWRDQTNANLVKNKSSVQEEINTLNNIIKPKNAADAAKSDYVQRPFDYIKLFFFNILSFIFNNKIIFYGILILIILAILRFIWNLIF